MSQRKTLLVIGSSAKVLWQAKALGLQVVYVQKREDMHMSISSCAHHIIFTDYEDRALFFPLARALHAVFHFDYVISLTESGLVLAAQLQETFGMMGNSVQTTMLLRDKWSMRQLLNAHNFSPVAARIGQREDDLHVFAQEYGLPFIVKPVDGVGSRGIMRITQQSEIQEAWEKLQGMGLASFLMEEFLDGPEVSVEAFSFHGRHVIIGIAEKRTLPNFVEIRHAVPAPLDGATEENITSTVTAFLSLVGLQEGPSHTELKLTAQGPRIIESHNRVGGGRITRLLDIVYGIDLVSLAYAWPTGLATSFDKPLAVRAGAATRFFAFSPGIVQRISGVDALQAREEIVEMDLKIKVGDRIAPICQSQDRPGYVVVKGIDVHEAIARSERLVQMIDVATLP